MLDLIVSSAIVFASALILVVVLRQFSSYAQTIIGLSFGAHILAAVGQVWITIYYYPGGDMVFYQFAGELLSRWALHSPWERIPELVRFALGDRQTVVPLFTADRSATTSMAGFSGLINLVTQGSLYATCMVVSMAAFASQVLLYHVFRHLFPPIYHRRLVWMIMLLPSVVYWSSGLVKEAVAMAGLGWVIFGAWEGIGRRRYLRGAVLLGLGALPIASVKAYVLLPLVASLAFWIYARGAVTARGSFLLRAKPVHLVFFVGVVLVAVVALGNLFPRYAVDNFAREAANLQEAGQTVRGGSNYVLGDPSQRSFAGQLIYAPVGLSYALFRPLVFEAHNIMSFFNSLETTGLAILLGIILFRRGLGQVWRMLSASPALLFCTAFVLLFGIGVGLTTTNLGTLSRYRIPMMPFYAMVLAVLFPIRVRSERRAQPRRRSLRPVAPT